MKRKVPCLLGVAVGGLLVHAAGSASETVTYTYDALGRLVATKSEGTVEHDLATAIGYDPAGNRCAYEASGTGAASATCGGGGDPPPGNNPPTANADWVAVPEWQSALIDVVANDTDVDGDLPLALTSVSDPSGHASVASSMQVAWSGAAAGTYPVQYMVQDSRGATATGTLTVEVAVTEPNPCWPNVCQ